MNVLMVSIITLLMLNVSNQIVLLILNGLIAFKIVSVIHHLLMFLLKIVLKLVIVKIQLMVCMLLKHYHYPCNLMLLTLVLILLIPMIGVIIVLDLVLKEKLLRIVNVLLLILK
jgi:hypothetical protein